MAKDKDKQNPVQQAHKAAKRAAIKKSKSTLAAARQDRLSKRDPGRLERRLASARSSGSNAREIETLEREIAAVRKARSAAGVEERPPREGRERHAHRRERDGEGDETDEEVRSIPMPRDTPPPIPRQPQREKDGKKEGKVKREAQMTYSAAPVLRDLKKESVKFAPAVVRRNIKLAKGEDGVVEEEEFERLEKAGYVQSQSREAQGETQTRGEEEGQIVEAGPRKVQMEDVDDEEDI